MERENKRVLFKLYTEKDVRKLVMRLREEYDEAARVQLEAAETLKEENRTLRARVLELEEERSGALAAFQAAEREREEIRQEGEKTLENDRRELVLLKEKCRLMLQTLERRYPDEEDTRMLSAFLDSLGAPPPDEDTGFDLEEVTSPKGPLDLKKLCLDLGLTEDDDEG